MAWSSFTDITDLAVSALKNNADLTAFCKAQWKKEQTVKKAFRQREEIATEERPIIMVTAPGLHNEPAAARLLLREHTIRLYCGFQEDDRTRAQDGTIKFEEYIEQALLLDTNLNSAGVMVMPGDAANDEGHFHPYYHLVMDFRLTVEREV